MLQSRSTSALVKLRCSGDEPGQGPEWAVPTFVQLGVNGRHTYWARNLQRFGRHGFWNSTLPDAQHETRHEYEPQTANPAQRRGKAQQIRQHADENGSASSRADADHDPKAHHTTA